MMRTFICLSALLLMLSWACCPASLIAAQPAPRPAPQNSEAALAAEAARREAALAAAVKNAYTPPPPGVMPPHDEIPLSGAWEDPDWDTPLMQSIYKNPYSYGNNLDNYLACLSEAVDGNPKAMLAVSMYCYLWSYVLEERYPDFPPQAHSVDFWRELAVRVTNPGWVALRLGDLHGRWPSSSLEYYSRAAELGNAEGMYNYYKATGKRLDYLYRSAALGCAKAAFLLGEELEKQGGEDNSALARRYIWLAAMNADEWGLLHSSFSFYNGEFGGRTAGQPGDCEQGYLYALLNMRYQYGNVFSTQRPDNICMLAPDAVSRLEAAADRWQADYDQRRLPHVLRVRYRSAPIIEELRGELAPLIAQLGLARRRAAESPAQPGQARQNGFAPALPVPWHLGFFSDEGETRAHGAALSVYSNERFSLAHSRYIPRVYAFVLLSMLMGAGFIAYARLQKRRKKRNGRKKSRDARPR